MTRHASVHRRGRTAGRPRRPGRRLAFRFSGVLVITAVTVAALLSVLAGAAFAYWVSTDSSNPAEAVAATLSAPTSGAQTGTATPTSVAITWTAPTDYTPTGYTVLRCTGSSCTNFTAVSNGTCSGRISTTSCTDTDTGLAAGTTYSYQVEADLDNWVSVPGSSFTAATSAVTSLAFTSQPSRDQDIQATGTGSFAVEVALEDTNGNVATSDNSDTVTLAIGDNPGGGILSCTGTGGLTVPVSSGVASFTGCAITKAGTGYELTASSATSTSLSAPANANSFDITAGTFAQFAVALPATATAGTATSVTLTAQDSDGNTVSYSGSETINWSGPAKSPNATAPTLPSGTVSFSAGVSTTSLSATFTDAGAQTLQAKDGSHLGSAVTTVSGGAPAALVLANCVVAGTAQACNGPYTLGGQSMVADVQALDQDGNAATITGTITMSVTSSNTTVFPVTAGATLSIDGTATPANQSTGTFTITDPPAGNATITVHVTSAPQTITDLTFTVKTGSG